MNIAGLHPVAGYAIEKSYMWPACHFSAHSSSEIYGNEHPGQRVLGHIIV